MEIFIPEMTARIVWNSKEIIQKYLNQSQSSKHEFPGSFGKHISQMVFSKLMGNVQDKGPKYGSSIITAEATPFFGM